MHVHDEGNGGRHGMSAATDHGGIVGDAPVTPARSPLPGEREDRVASANEGGSRLEAEPGEPSLAWFSGASLGVL